jgi:hypothetical protein
MNNRDQWLEYHTRQASHAVTKAKSHASLRDLHKRLAAWHTAKVEDGDESHNEAAECHAVMADKHDFLTERYTDEGEYHAGKAKILKAMGSGDNDELEKRSGIMPDSVMGVIPDNVRAVPRHGAPELGNGLVDTSTVDPALRKFVQVDATDTD